LGQAAQQDVRKGRGSLTFATRGYLGSVHEVQVHVRVGPKRQKVIIEFTWRRGGDGDFTRPGHSGGNELAGPTHGFHGLV
jgi:hypothetical protein